MSDLFISISKQLPVAAAETNALPEILDPYGGVQHKNRCC